MPTPLISNLGDFSNDKPLEFTVTFSEFVDGFIATDLTLSSGDATITTSDNIVYNKGMVGYGRSILCSVGFSF